MNKSATILVVEDAPEMLELIAGALEDQGFAVVRARNLADMRRCLPWAKADVILLDINLPDGDGVAAAVELRLRDKAGLIFVTARDAEEDRVQALEKAGDDYLTKPVSVRELIARINNVRRLREAKAVALVEIDGWNLDPIRRELFRPDGSLLPLTTGEFNILAALAAARPQPLDRDFLLDVISNRDPRSVTAHTVDTLIGRLRRKLEFPQGGSLTITTIRGTGYALSVPVEGRGEK